MASPRQSENPAQFDEPVARDHEIRAVKSFADLLALAAEKRDLTMKSALERDVRLVRFEDGTLELALEPSARKTLVQELSKKLAEWTGRRWMVAVSAEAGQPSLRAQADARKAELKDVVREDPLVQAVLQRFPGAEIVDVRPPAGNTEDLPLETPANESDPDA
jgi:DNA polymerase-3 subunit gamma/tau